MTRIVNSRTFYSMFSSGTASCLTYLQFQELRSHDVPSLLFDKHHDLKKKRIKCKFCYIIRINMCKRLFVIQHLIVPTTVRTMYHKYMHDLHVKM